MTQLSFFETSSTPAMVRVTKPRVALPVTKPVPFVRDSETSKAAAETVLNAVAQENRVLEILRACGPLTDEEIHREYVLRHSEQSQPCKDSSIRRARVELVNDGMVFDSGKTRAGLSGRQMTIWSVNRP